MVTRSRDLDLFEHASREDVRLVDCGGGLQFAILGAKPAHRLLLESVYAFLTLKNGVPVGYVLASALFGSSEIAYNVFETFRGGESGAVYGRALATVRHLFGADTFTIFPYQLGGYGNPEALTSGAWWFYRKLGFLPKHPGAVELMKDEERRMKSRPSYRSSVTTLKKLAAENLYFHVETRRDDVIGILELPSVGLKVTEAIAARFGSDREKAERTLERKAPRSWAFGPFPAGTPTNVSGGSAGRRSSRSCPASRAGAPAPAAPSFPSSAPRAAAASPTSSASSTPTARSGARSGRSRCPSKPATSAPVSSLQLGFRRHA